jgi:HEXXH motif-containing protein
LLTSHLLPDAAFRALAAGTGPPATIRLLRDAQLSKHLMLLHGIADAAGTAARTGCSVCRTWAAGLMTA